MRERTMNMKATKKVYTDKVVPGLKEALGVQNPMAVPHLAKVVVNAGIGRFLKDSKHVEEVVKSLESITGQKVLLTKARKAIAGFKIREGLEVGARVTLHGARMWDFLDRLINVALPRVRDFQGLPISNVDTYGNCNIGIKDHSVFPEIVPEKVQHIFGFQITIVTTAKDKPTGESLFRLLGMPLSNEETHQSMK